MKWTNLHQITSSHFATSARHVSSLQWGAGLRCPGYRHRSSNQFTALSFSSSSRLLCLCLPFDVAFLKLCEICSLPRLPPVPESQCWDHCSRLPSSRPEVLECLIWACFCFLWYLYLSINSAAENFIKDPVMSHWLRFLNQEAIFKEVPLSSRLKEKRPSVPVTSDDFRNYPPQMRSSIKSDLAKHHRSPMIDSFLAQSWANRCPCLEGEPTSAR